MKTLRLLSFSALFLVAANLFAANPTTDPLSYDRLLVPLLTQPIFGANGSEFRTELRVWNKSTTETLQLYGIEPSCLITCPVWDSNLPFEVPVWSSQQQEPPQLAPNGNPGRFVYVSKSQSDQVAMNLRAFDVSRSASNFGTQIPVVLDRDFSNERIVLPGVPMANNLFRKTLRIYSTVAVKVALSYQGTVVFSGPPPPGILLPQIVTLRPGANLFEPAFATVTDFPDYSPFASGDTMLTLVIEPIPDCPICPLPHVTAPIWAFISVTNNETQHITTISPQP
jgi:hypothetical protein